jgi:archaetidylinositol phosphate synthase
MALENYRKQADPFITPVAMKLKNVNPNVISWIGLALAFVAGTLFYFSGYEYQKHYELLLLGALVVLVSGYFDALDGKVARIWNKCSKKGDYLDHVFDRYADVFIIGGIGISEWCNPYWTLAAMIGVLLTSYMGTQAQAIGAPRLYTGILGRTDRLIMATIFPIAQFISVQCFDFYEFYVEFGWGSFTVTWVEFMVIYFAIVANITAIQRGIITWKNMSKQEDVFGTQETKAAFEGEIVGQGENTMDVKAGEPAETEEVKAEPPEDKGSQ